LSTLVNYNCKSICKIVTGWADVFLGLSVDAGVEDVAGAGVGVGVEPVQTGALVVGSSGSFWKFKIEKNC